MESIQAISDIFPSTAPVATTKNTLEDLGSAEFLTLMVAQLENQDPTKPMDNMQFLSQIAQFGTVSGIQDLRQDFGGVSSALYANQVLDAASLVGRSVVTESNVGVLTEGEPLEATINLPEPSTAVTLYVQDLNGRLVYSQPMGAAAGGEQKVQWDGTDEEGNQLTPGQYRISAEAYIDGKNQGVPVYTHSLVESVTLGEQGNSVLLNLSGGAQVGMSSVKSFL